MYLVALMEWGLTPEYINENWTEELFALMFEKRTKLFCNVEDDGKTPMSAKSFIEKHGLKAPKRVSIRRK